jgi:hypothetical protein
MADESKPSSYDESVMKTLGSFRRTSTTDDNPEVAEMRKNRAVNRRTASATSGAGRGGSQLSFATGRPRDPLFYWKQNNLPYEVEKHEELKKVRAFCRLLYLTHPIVASCVDIYSKYPLLGSELVCKDEQLTEFYTDLFFSPDGLNYDKFLIDIGKQYWTVGEAMSLGSFNEALGVWEDEELLNPDDVEVERSPFSRDPHLYIKLPQSLREIIQKRSPSYEYERLIQNYPELLQYASDGALMPVSNVLLKQMKFEADTFNKRGVPILMRAMRAVMQEEMLNAAQDAIADRLYTPLILAKLGASAGDLGTTVPWIPTDDDLGNFEEALDQALAADFRVLVHHFGIQMESVFGRENMPDMSADFDRLEGRILQSFGLSQTMLSGASAGETYAADALNRDLVSQLLTSYQQMIANHYRSRALIVAEAQEHFDYEVRNGKRYVKMEEVLEIDEETGEERIVEQPKLLIPELRFKTMNLSDEQNQRDFYEQLRAAGVPISIKTRLLNIPFDLDEEVERTQEEQVQLAIAEQETRKAMYQALRDRGLPIPMDLRADFEPTAGPSADAMQNTRVTTLGTDPNAIQPNLAPTEDDLMNTIPSNLEDEVQAEQDDAPAQRPEESDEMRAGMPSQAVLYKQAGRMRGIAREHYKIPAPLEENNDAIYNESGLLLPSDPLPRGKFGDPKVVGMRRHLTREDIDLDEDQA